MNETLFKLALGQIAHQAMNRKRLNEIIELAVGKSDQDVMNGLDSYITGAIGPLIITLHAGDPEGLPQTLARIEALAKLILANKPGSH